MEIILKILAFFKKWSAPRKPRKIHLKSKGQYFDLKELYDKVHEKYFAGNLKLHITWFNPKKSKYTHRIVLGSFHRDHQLIRINRALDQPDIPEFFVSFVIYHEILHHVLPPIHHSRKRQIHHAAFKAQEREFQEYALVKEFQRASKKRWFLD